MWKFRPIYKTKIWGGHKIAALKHFSSDEKIGECWLLSGVPGDLSVVEDGPDRGLTIRQLIENDGASLLGKNNFLRFGETFPLLIKIIDAADKLSVQVHPDDAMAQSLGHPRGKTEMWYALDSDDDASLTLGFNTDVDPEEFRRMVDDGTVENVLNSEPVHAGDVFFIPAGTIHAIGKGCMVIEIQQTSDDTYRIYDYKRRDKDGRERELHVDLAMRALNFKHTSGAPVEYTAHPDIPVNIVRSPYFSTNVMTLDEPLLRDYSECDSFVVIIAAKGDARLVSDSGDMDLHAGELALVPASTDNVNIEPVSEFTAVESYIKQ